MELMKVVFQVFPAAAATNMERSPTLIPPVAGGVLRRTLQPVPGTAAWVTTLAMCTGTTTIRKMGSLSVASGINSFDLFDNLII